MIQTINISLIPSDNKPVINVSQFDNVSRVLRFNVFDDADMETPHVFEDGDTVLLNIRKNDNNIVVITGVIVSDIDPETQEVTEQYLTFELTEQACACVGSNYGEVSITSGDNEIIGSCNFKFIVERSPLAGGLTSQSAIDNLTTQITQITEEVVGENYYNKTEVDGLLDDKADANNVYTKTETDNLLNGKADANNVYTKTETDNLLNGKADANNVYTKTETDNKIAALIDDTQTVNNKTWSSNKISDELYALLPVGTASGAIAHFETDIVSPLQESKVTIPVNVDGISGISITNCKTNLLNPDSMSLIDIRGDSTMRYGISINKPGNYCIISVNNDAFLYAKKIVNGVYGSNIYVQTSTTKYTTNVTLNDGETLLFYDAVSSDSFDQAKDYMSNCQIAVGTSIINFESYNGNTQTVTFTNPITDGAEIDLLTGEVKINTTPPTSDTITPININTFKGVNNIYSDVGETSVSYKDTIQHYIDYNIASLQALILSI